jgi:hypothetical protein
MRKAEDRERTYTHKQVVSITCDRCGNEMLDPKGATTFNPGWIRGGTVHVSGFGYGSKHDLSMWDLDVCDACVPGLLAWFKRRERDGE